MVFCRVLRIAGFVLRCNYGCDFKILESWRRVLLGCSSSTPLINEIIPLYYPIGPPVETFLCSRCSFSSKQNELSVKPLWLLAHNCVA
jgi:hypothetical protein